MQHCPRRQQIGSVEANGSGMTGMGITSTFATRVCAGQTADEENLGVTNCWILKTRERINCEKEIILDGCFCIIISVSIFLVFDFHLFSFYGYYRSNNYFLCACPPIGTGVFWDRGVFKETVKRDTDTSVCGADHQLQVLQSQISLK